MIHLPSAPQCFYVRLDELDDFVNETPRFSFAFLAKINQLSIDPITGRPPTILVEQAPPINAEGDVLAQQFMKFDNHGLNESGNAQGVIDPRLGITYSYFQSVEERVKPDVPPNFFGIINTTSLNEKFAVIVVLRKRFKGIRNTGPRETLKNLEPIALEPSIMTNPERRVHRQGVNVGEEVTGLVHNMDGCVPIWYANMNMQSKNQVGAGE